MDRKSIPSAKKTASDGLDRAKTRIKSLDPEAIQSDLITLMDSQLLIPARRVHDEGKCLPNNR
jgi:hypothetical protein